ncbi:MULTISPECIES: ATP-dependent nuclease [unclassified Francisella]|uniref:ATP-dependent nuclease n=1 Tax=unclassified Francisella TaxID=2610885 RepID=UPI002E37CA10|nr:MULTISPECIES: AAA family ATPase [unclassified Francisella]MED7819073.1 AAA family ATPase [Francisella sp. 19S2-4]MED7829910.1 AAA family ATPase [Francisella sp. 19S2-10]
MYISSLKIRNFRNFLCSKFLFKKGVNTILGENGSGKTNALFALRLLLDESLPRNVTKLRDGDFCRNLAGWKGHWIVISVDFDELSAHEGCQMLKHNAGHMDGSDKGTLTYYFRPCLKTRKALFEASGNMALAQQIIDEISIEDYEPVFSGRANADFLCDDAYKNLVGDFQNFEFPDPESKDFKAYGINISPLHEEVSFTFVKALRDVVSDLKNYRKSPLIALLKGLESEISDEDSENITGLVSDINNVISELDEIKKVSRGIQDTLHKTVGYTFSPVIDIESSLPSELDKLLQKLSLTVGDNYVDGYSGDLNELSLGGANLIYVALKLLEYERKQEADKAAQFLVIEEPEAHIHTHIQKTLFENNAINKTQVFLSTHSTHISSVAKISEINILGLNGNYVDVFQPSKNLNPIECSRIERYLNATRSTLLFAKGVILVEGDAELILIPTLVKKVFGVSLDELGISLISMDSAFFKHVSNLFHPDRIRKNCAIITDLDASIEPLPDNENDDNKYQKSCRNSQKSGVDRKDDLDEYTKSNDYISAFYASHTFEVDFVGADKSNVLDDVLPSIYKQEASINNSKSLLKNSEVKIYGKEILRLANKVGKGWLSLLISEKVTSQTSIPRYILDAIAFSCGYKLTPQILYKMLCYRLSNNPMPVMEDKDKPIQFFTKNSVDINACIVEFEERCPDDDLFNLIKLLDQ